MKRFVFKFALYLLSGMIVNVAVAWGCAEWSLVSVYWNTGSTRWPGPVPDNWPAPDSMSSWRGFGVDLFRTVSWSPKQNKNEGSTSLSGWFQFDRYKAGLPFRAVAGHERWGPAPFGGSIQTANLPVAPMNNKRGLKSLPLLPIWPGFAINTIFYAAILWLITLAPFLIRRTLRSKQGRCINCGYDLRGDITAGCPECGWQRDKREVATKASKQQFNQI